MNDTIHYMGTSDWETESFRAKQKELDNKNAALHFLDTPAGRDWDNIVEWKKAQKVNKTNK